MVLGPVALSGTGGKRRMRVIYDPEADVLGLVLRDDPPVDAVEEPGG